MALHKFIYVLLINIKYSSVSDSSVFRNIWDQQRWVITKEGMSWRLAKGSWRVCLLQVSIRTQQWIVEYLTEQIELGRYFVNWKLVGIVDWDWRSRDKVKIYNKGKTLCRSKQDNVLTTLRTIIPVVRGIVQDS